MKYFLPVLALVVLGGMAAVGRAQDVDPEHVVAVIEKVEIEATQYSDKFPDVAGVKREKNEDYLRILVHYRLDWAPARGGNYANFYASRYRTAAARGFFIDKAEFSFRVLVGVGKDFEARERGKRLNALKSNDLEVLRADRVVNLGFIPIGDRRRRSIETLYIHPNVLRRFFANPRRLKAEDVMLNVKVRIGGKTRGEGIFWGEEPAIAANAATTGLTGPVVSAAASGNARQQEVLSWLDYEGIPRTEGALLTRRETPWAWSYEENFEVILPEEKK